VAINVSVSGDSLVDGQPSRYAGDYLKGTSAQAFVSLNQGGERSFMTYQDFLLPQRRTTSSFGGINKDQILIHPLGV